MTDSGLELRELRTFLAVYDELNFARAADRLGLTPSRVSQTIRTLEARAGGPLFERSSRRVAPTALGRQLHDRTAPAVHELEVGFAAVRASAGGPTGILRIGLYSSVVGGGQLANVIRTFNRLHPACEVIQLDTGFERHQLDWLRNGDTDLLVMRLPLRDPDLTIGPILSREPRVAALSVDHPLAGRRSISVEDLADHSVTDAQTLPREMMRSFIPELTPSGRAIPRVFVRSIAESIARVTVDQTIHLTVASFLDHVRHPDITTVPVSDLPPSETALVWLTARTTPAIQAFAGVAVETDRPHGQSAAISGATTETP